MYFSPLYRPFKVVTSSLVALVAISLASAASAQNQYPVYSENFNGLDAGQTLSDNDGFTTNDEDTGGKYQYSTTVGGVTSFHTGTIGQSDYVGDISFFEAGGGAGNNTAFLGGAFGHAVAPGAVGTAGTVTLNEPLPSTAGSAAVTFSTDFAITNPNASYPNQDSFAFTLRNTAGIALISIGFVPGGVNVNNLLVDNVTYTAGAANGASGMAALPLGSNYRYKLTISVNVAAGTFSATVQQESTVDGSLTGGVATLVSNATYSAAAVGAIAGYQVGWTLADKTDTALATNGLAAGTNNVALTGAGINAIYFDNVLETVPEPSTYALMGLGAGGLVFAVRRARKARFA